MICDKNASVTVTTPVNRNFIYETVRKIDQLQKEVLLENGCIGCEGSLFSRLYNTKPVSFDKLSLKESYTPYLSKQILNLNYT